ncbi:MAG: CRISPR-associated endonuclease Cas2 [Candidatus Marinimicrobia bacterium]|nr:CRISPR-associated endonuclease Cas2 [Candidatus Neomarinimicrobiota bacterium]MDD5583228.1 CRISPR-associated endonuclease Cas2 [Candidatus Neomarinimicrobiota bacterium]
MKKNEQLTWVIYDISKNKARRKIVKATEEAGLYRVQKSVFLGSINRASLDEMILKVKEWLNEETDSVYVFPMCETDFKKIILLGQAFDKDMVTDEIVSLFF